MIPEGFGRDVGAGHDAHGAGHHQRRQREHRDDGDGLCRRASCAPSAAQLAPGSVQLSRPITVEPRIWYNPELRSTLFLVPGLIAYIAMITAVTSTALSIVREKEFGTMEQVRMAPIDTFSFVVGKTIPYFVISLASAALIILASMVLFGLPMRGNWLSLLVALSLFLVGALGTGLLISTVAGDAAGCVPDGAADLAAADDHAVRASSFRSPACRRRCSSITYVVPARYFLIALRGIVLKGSPIAHLVAAARRAGVYALAMLSLASVRLARERA